MLQCGVSCISWWCVVGGCGVVVGGGVVGVAVGVVVGVVVGVGFGSGVGNNGDGDTDSNILVREEAALLNMAAVVAATASST